MLLVAPDDVVITPNGIDEQFFESGGMAAALHKYFLFVGNDKPHKNVSVAMEAAHRIGVELRQVGAARFVSEDELASLYRGAIALVMPSREEGFGLPALEAMRCGTAVITSTAPALVEVTGDAALHVAPNAGAFADAMSRLMRDPSLRASFIARGASRAAQFTWSRCAAMTRDVYFELPF
jgi:glycosyltransferase involved in cell wall biosynthesis